MGFHQSQIYCKIKTDSFNLVFVIKNSVFLSYTKQRSKGIIGGNKSIYLRRGNTIFFKLRSCMNGNLSNNVYCVFLKSINNMYRNHKLMWKYINDFKH